MSQFYNAETLQRINPHLTLMREPLLLHFCDCKKEAMDYDSTVKAVRDALIHHLQIPLTFSVPPIAEYSDRDRSVLIVVDGKDMAFSERGHLLMDSEGNVMCRTTDPISLEWCRRLRVAWSACPLANPKKTSLTLMFTRKEFIEGRALYLQERLAEWELLEPNHPIVVIRKRPPLRFRTGRTCQGLEADSVLVRLHPRSLKGFQSIMAVDRIRPYLRWEDPRMYDRHSPFFVNFSRATDFAAVQIRDTVPRYTSMCTITSAAFLLESRWDSLQEIVDVLQLRDPLKDL